MVGYWSRLSSFDYHELFGGWFAFYLIPFDGMIIIEPIWGELVGLMEFDERKVLKFGENVIWVEKKSENGWEV
jgi:hypothetical protein